MTKQFVWSDEQKAIFKWFENGREHLVVEARAGCAKTTTIEQGITKAPESSILYVVFNKKNQLEAVAKIKDPRVKIVTHHALGLSYLKNLWPRLRADGFAESDRVKIACPEFPVEFTFVVCRLISYLKNLYINPTLENAKEIAEVKGIELFGENAKWNDQIPQIALDAIELSKTNRDNRISFDDMIYLPNVLGLIKPLFNLICCDETQDCNVPQLDTLQKALIPGGRICLVGDTMQGIYGWRGSLQNSMAIFKEKLKANELKLTITYRCPKVVVQKAQTLVPDYKFADFARDGELLSMEYKKAIESLKVGDVVLSRKNAPLMPVALKLIRNKVSAYVVGRDIAKKLIQIVNGLEAADTFDFGNKIQTWLDSRVGILTAKGGRMMAQKIELIKDEAETLQAINHDVIATGGKSIQDIIDKIKSIFFDSEYVKRPSVVCSSVHRAKGLEWPTVYMLDETFYVSHPKQTQEDKQEERNIHYVAITRAQNKLVCVNGLGKD